MVGYSGLRPLWADACWLKTSEPISFQNWSIDANTWYDLARHDLYTEIRRSDIYGDRPPFSHAEDRFIVDVTATVGEVAVDPPDLAPFRLGVALSNSTPGGRSPCIVASSLYAPATPLQLGSVQATYRAAFHSHVVPRPSGLPPEIYLPLFLANDDVATFRIVAGYASSVALKVPPTMTIGRGDASSTGFTITISSFELPD